MNLYTEQERQDITLFRQEFERYYQIRPTEPFCQHDLNMTAYTTNQTYSIEVKKRQFLIETISASTIIEKSKIQHFQDLYMDNPGTCLVYFNYYFRDWIAFDISNRIKYNQLPSYSVRELPCKSLESIGSVSKCVGYLSYTCNEYIKDRICVKPQIQII